MATYNNQHWLLSHIRNSFISTDDTGMCETVMISEDLPNQYAKLHRAAEDVENYSPNNDDCYCYPGLDQSDDEEADVLSQSYDVQMDPDYGLHRQRSNTAQKLEKMDIARRKAAKTRSIKCDDPILAPTPQEAERSQLFVRKAVSQSGGSLKPSVSLLSEQLTRCPKQPQNKFLEYARFDGTAQTEVTTRTHKIFLTMLPENIRNYPLEVCVTASAKVYELIGLICYKCSIANPEYTLASVRSYALQIAEEDGEVDRDFPPLDTSEKCSKFCFTHLALVEKKISPDGVQPPSQLILQPAFSITSETEAIGAAIIAEAKASSVQQSEDLARMLGHTTRMEAPHYRTYRVHILNKGVFKTAIQLGISGEKIEIDPVQANSKIWPRQKAISHCMDSIAWCEVTEIRTTRSIFRIVYSGTSNSASAVNPGGGPCPNTGEFNVTISSSPLQSSASFKHYDFETDPNTAQEITDKINNILEVRSSASRREYIGSKEKRKQGHSRRPFHFIK